LNALRRDIDRKPHKIKRVLTDAGIRGSFLGGVADDEKAAVKAFTNQPSNQSTALKKHPKVSYATCFAWRLSICCTEEKVAATSWLDI